MDTQFVLKVEGVIDHGPQPGWSLIYESHRALKNPHSMRTSVFKFELIFKITNTSELSDNQSTLHLFFTDCNHVYAYKVSCFLMSFLVILLYVRLAVKQCSTEQKSLL